MVRPGPDEYFGNESDTEFTAESKNYEQMDTSKLDWELGFSQSGMTDPKKIELLTKLQDKRYLDMSTDDLKDLLSYYFGSKAVGKMSTDEMTKLLDLCVDGRYTEMDEHFLQSLLSWYFEPEVVDRMSGKDMVYLLHESHATWRFKKG